MKNADARTSAIAGFNSEMKRPVFKKKAALSVSLPSRRTLDDSSKQTVKTGQKAFTAIGYGICGTRRNAGHRVAWNRPLAAPFFNAARRVHDGQDNHADRT